MWSGWNSHTAGWGVTWHNYSSLAVSYKVKCAYIRGPSSITPRHLPPPPKMKTRAYTKTCVWMFIAALFKVTKNWKQSKRPSAGEPIKLWCIHTMEYNPAIKTEQVTDTFKSMDESQKHYAAREAKHKRLHTVWFHLYDIPEKQNYRDRSQVSGCHYNNPSENWWLRNDGSWDQGMVVETARCGHNLDKKRVIRSCWQTGWGERGKG